MELTTKCLQGFNYRYSFISNLAIIKGQDFKTRAYQILAFLFHKVRDSYMGFDKQLVQI